MINIKKLVAPAALAAVSFVCTPSMADTILEGFSYTNGYARGGFNTAPSNRPDGGYSLGGSMQKFRLGNEMDQYFEVLLNYGQKMDNDLTWGLHWMPALGNGNYSTAQAYMNITGVSFAPNLTFWAGQRYHRIQDIHIVDNWMMQDGDNLGAGVDDINVGYGKLNVAIHGSENVSDKAGSDGARHNSARRINFQWRDLPLYVGGNLTFTAALVKGKFGVRKVDGTIDNNEGNSGVALGLLHKHTIAPIGGENQLFLQGSWAHAGIDGKFYNLGTTTQVGGATQYNDTAGAKQFRIADVLNWQVGSVGGQALIGYHSITVDKDYCDDATANCKTRDFTFGGRASWGFARHLKLLGELGYTRRKVDSDQGQNLTKATLAVAISPDGTDNGKDKGYPEFWSRPELRLFVSAANWNDAAAAANGGTGFAGNNADGKARKSAIWTGVQFETWF